MKIQTVVTYILIAIVIILVLPNALVLLFVGLIELFFSVCILLPFISWLQVFY